MNLIDNRTAYNREQYQGYHNTHEYISIHYLGVDGENPDLYNNGYGGHYTIMWNGDIYWSADHYAVLWQVGTAGVYTKKYPNGWDVTNYNSIGIEMCCHYTDGHWWFTEETQKACVELVKYLMGMLKIDADHVLRHYDIVNKRCPEPYVNNEKYKSSWTWDEFKAKIRGGSMATDWKQYSPEFYDVIYSGGTLAEQGCGPCSCADLLNISPRITAKWLTNNGYAVPGHGTEWTGIAPCLTAFGGGGKQLNSNSLLTWRTSPVFDAWQRHIQSGYMGILLMGAGKSTYWTRSGHFISIVEYRDGMYLVYDPASENRTGWHPWTDFAGDIKVCYTSSIRWGNPQDEEDIVVSEIFKNARIDKEFDRPVMRYVGIDKLEVKEAPGKDAPRHSYWPWLSKNNGVKVFYGFDTGYVQVSMSNGKGTGTSGYVEAKYLSKKKV